MKQILVCLLVIVSSLLGIGDGQEENRFATPCMTPRNEVGLCTEHQSCPFILKIINREEFQHYVNLSKCGPKNEDQEQFRVCCPIRASETTTTRTIGPVTTRVPSTTPFLPSTSSAPKPASQTEPPAGSKFAPQEDSQAGKVQSPTETPLIPPGSCGIQSPVLENRIFGGQEAEIGEFPWMARIQHRTEYGNLQVGCVGFLIDDLHVMTAAHCVQSSALRRIGPIYQVVLGEHNVETDEDCTVNRTYCADPVVVVKTKNAIVHPEYDGVSKNHYNDIAIIPLETRVKYSNFIQPICLMGRPSRERTMWVSGWGKTETDVSSTKKLRVSVSYVNFTECQRIYSKINVNLTTTQICAGEEGKDTCRGDSGGPLMVKDSENRWYAEGIVSFGLACGRKEWPAVYTNIPSYSNWIVNELRKERRN